jgi:hypothetical protein
MSEDRGKGQTAMQDNKHNTQDDIGDDTVDDTEEAIEELFERYAEAFGDFDGEAVCAGFHFPTIIWQFDKANLFADAEELMENIEALFAVLEREDIVQSDFEILDLAVMDNSALALVEWTQSRADGEAAWTFTCSYHLIGLDGRWGIVTIVNPFEP